MYIPTRPGLSLNNWVVSNGIVWSYFFTWPFSVLLCEKEISNLWMKTVFRKLDIFIPIWDFAKSGDCYPGDRGFFKIFRFLSQARGLGISENLRIIMPRISDFGKSGNFYICEIPGIYIIYIFADFQNFLSPGFSGMGFFGDGDFFCGMGYPIKKQLLLIYY